MDVQGMFDRLVPRYDRFNFLSSAGLDHRWRRSLVAMIPPGGSVLDIGTGTGDSALSSLSQAQRVTGIDFSPAMVREAHRKAAGRERVQFCVAGAQELPFRDASFEAVISSFVLRNLFRLGILETSCQEAFRVLKCGGRLVFLELTRPTRTLLKWGHWIYLNTMLPLIGRTLFTNRWPGGYLRRSIEEFPEPDRVIHTLESIGFEEASFRPLSQGIAGIFSASKP